MSKASSSKKDSGGSASGGGIERRRTRRRPILSTFSLFCVVPSKGFHRLQVHDVSDHGIGFDFDAEGEDAKSFPLAAGEQLEVHFYLNQSLYLPLTVRIMRIEETSSKVRRLGAEFNQKDKGFQAFAAFLKMLDTLADVAQIQSV